MNIRFALPLAIGINALALLVTYAIVTPFFLSNDDVSMMLRAAGVLILDEPTGYLLFTSGIIGNVLKQLYLWEREVPWYGLYYAVTLWLIHSVVLTLLLTKWKCKRGLMMFLIYYLCGGIYFSIAWQFTMLSILACVAGACVIVYARRSDDSGVCFYTFVLLGAMLTLLSALIRLDGFYAGILLAAPILFFDAVVSKRYKRVALLGLVCVSVVLFRLQWNKIENEANNGFSQFNFKRSTLSEYGFISRDSIAMQPLMQRTGWSYNDAQALRAWLFTDTATFNNQSFDNALNGDKPNRESDVLFNAVTRHVDFIGDKVVLLWSIWFLALLMLVANRYDKRYLWTALFLILWLNVILILIGMLTKPPPFRVQYPLWLSMCVVLTLRSSGELLVRKNLWRGAYVTCTVAGCLLMYKGVHTSNGYRANEKQMQQTLAAIPSNGPSVNWGGALPLESISPFSNLSSYRLHQVIALGVFERAPQDVAYIERLTFGNDLENALVEQQLPILVHRNATQEYLHILSTRYAEHKGIEVTYQKVFADSSLSVFRVTAVTSNKLLTD